MYANSQLGVGARPLGRLIIAPLKRYRNCRAPLLILQACMASLAGRPSKRQRLDARHVQDTCSLDLGQGAHVDYAKAAFAEAQATQLLERIKQGAALEQRPVVIMGRRVLQPRLTAFQGDPGCIYKYSGVEMQSAPWDAAVLEVKERVEELAGSEFNACLLNLYRSGQDNLGWHSDNEKSLGPTIGSVSLGAPRDFVLRRNTDHSDRLVFSLSHGDVLIMRGTTQKHWMHSVPKRAAAQGERLNLTFRQVAHPDGRPRRSLQVAVAQAGGPGAPEPGGVCAASNMPSA